MKKTFLSILFLHCLILSSNSQIRLSSIETGSVLMESYNVNNQLVIQGLNHSQNTVPVIFFIGNAYISKEYSPFYLNPGQTFTIGLDTDWQPAMGDYILMSVSKVHYNLQINLDCQIEQFTSNQRLAEIRMEAERRAIAYQRQQQNQNQTSNYYDMPELNTGFEDIDQIPSTLPRESSIPDLPSFEEYIGEESYQEMQELIEKSQEPEPEFIPKRALAEQCKQTMETLEIRLEDAEDDWSKAAAALRRNPSSPTAVSRELTTRQHVTMLQFGIIKWRNRWLACLEAEE